MFEMVQHFDEMDLKDKEIKLEKLNGEIKLIENVDLVYDELSDYVDLIRELKTSCSRCYSGYPDLINASQRKYDSYLFILLIDLVQKFKNIDLDKISHITGYSGLSMKRVEFFKGTNN